MTDPNEERSALEVLEDESPGEILPIVDADGELHEYRSVFDD